MAQPTEIDLSLLTDEALASLSQRIAEEQSRREDISRLPDTIATLTQHFIDQGGSKNNIRPPESYTKGNSETNKTPKPPKANSK